MSGATLVGLAQVAQPSRDLARSTAFYRDALGLRHVATFDPPGLAFFDLGGTRLMLDAIPGAIDHAGSPLYFRVDDVAAAVKALRERGVAFDQAPERIHRDDAGDFGEPGAEEWMAFFRDPDGNVLALVERRALA